MELYNNIILLWLEGNLIICLHLITSLTEKVNHELERGSQVQKQRTAKSQALSFLMLGKMKEGRENWTAVILL